MCTAGPALMLKISSSRLPDWVYFTQSWIFNSHTIILCNPFLFLRSIYNLSPGNDMEGTVEVGVDALEEGFLSAARASLMSKFLLGLRSVSSRNCEIKLNSICHGMPKNIQGRLQVTT